MHFGLREVAHAYIGHVSSRSIKLIGVIGEIARIKLVIAIHPEVCGNAARQVEMAPKSIQISHPPIPFDVVAIALALEVVVVPVKDHRSADRVRLP